MIGSIVPDFPYFIREFGAASVVHTFMGALCISLPVGLVVYLLVCLSIGRIADALPKPHSDFLASWGIGGPSSKRNPLGIVAAVFVGALSHNFIDSFTHESGAAVSMFSVLGKEVFSLGGEPVHVFRVLQYSGSVIGMVMIVAAYGFGLRRYCHAKGCRVWQDSRRWLILIGLTSAAMLVAVAMNAEFIPRRLDFYAFRVFGFKFMITWLPIVGMAFLCFVALRSRDA